MSNISPWLQAELDRFLAERFASPGPRATPLRTIVSAHTGIPEEAIGEVRPIGKDKDSHQVVEAEVKIGEGGVQIDADLWQVG
jgi:hypothetical protein